MHNNTKRLLSILVVLCMLLSLVPVPALADYDDEIIWDVEVDGLAMPRLFGYPDGLYPNGDFSDVEVTEGAYIPDVCYIYGEEHRGIQYFKYYDMAWPSNYYEVRFMDPTETFRADQYYGAAITLYPEDGYCFDLDSTASVNAEQWFGNNNNMWFNDDGSVTLLFDCGCIETGEPIYGEDITVTLNPLEGNQIFGSTDDLFSLNYGSASRHITLSDAKVFEGCGFDTDPLPYGTVIEGGEFYSYSVKFTLDEGYQFASDTVNLRITGDPGYYNTWLTLNEDATEGVLGVWETSPQCPVTARVPNYSCFMPGEFYLDLDGAVDEVAFIRDATDGTVHNRFSPEEITDEDVTTAGRHYISFGGSERRVTFDCRFEFRIGSRNYTTDHFTMEYFPMNEMIPEIELDGGMLYGGTVFTGDVNDYFTVPEDAPYTLTGIRVYNNDTLETLNPGDTIIAYTTYKVHAYITADEGYNFTNTQNGDHFARPTFTLHGGRFSSGGNNPINILNEETRAYCCTNIALPALAPIFEFDFEEDVYLYHDYAPLYTMEFCTYDTMDYFEIQYKYPGDDDFHADAGIYDFEAGEYGVTAFFKGFSYRIRVMLVYDGKTYYSPVINVWSENAVEIGSVEIKGLTVPEAFASADCSPYTDLDDPYYIDLASGWYDSEGLGVDYFEPGRTYYYDMVVREESNDDISDPEYKDYYFADDLEVLVDNFSGDEITVEHYVSNNIYTVRVCYFVLDALPAEPDDVFIPQCAEAGSDDVVIMPIGSTIDAEGYGIEYLIDNGWYEIYGMIGEATQAVLIYDEGYAGRTFLARFVAHAPNGTTYYGNTFYITYGYLTVPADEPIYLEYTSLNGDITPSDVEFSYDSMFFDIPSAITWYDVTADEYLGDNEYFTEGHEYGIRFDLSLSYDSIASGWRFDPDNYVDGKVPLVINGLPAEGTLIQNVADVSYTYMEVVILDTARTVITELDAFGLNEPELGMEWDDYVEAPDYAPYTAYLMLWLDITSREDYYILQSGDTFEAGTGYRVRIVFNLPYDSEYVFGNAGDLTCRVDGRCADDMNVYRINGFEVVAEFDFDHPHVFTEAEYVAPTCTDWGWRYLVCEECGESIYDDYPAAGHTWQDGCCTVCGAIYGDVDGDGKVTAKDVNLMKQIVLGTVDAIPADADLSGDRKVSVADVAILKALILG